MRGGSYPAIAWDSRYARERVGVVQGLVFPAAAGRGGSRPFAGAGGAESGWDVFARAAE